MIEEAIEQYYVQQDENGKQVFFGSVNHTYFGILWECTGLIV